MLNYIKKRYQEWKDKRFLKKHHVSTWREYHHVYDKRINRGTSYLSRYYHGYPATVTITMDKLEGSPWWFHPFASDAHGLLIWCQENCEDDWRHDWFRGSFMNDDFRISDMGSEDIVVFAFHNELDAFNFKMVWS